jgi:Tol biopolymer transport system component
VCSHVRWSPDGQSVAFLDNQDILYLLDAASFSLLRSFEIGPLVESSFIWSPDSKFVAVSRHYGEPGPGPKEIARVDIETGEIVRLTNNESVEFLTGWVILPSR